MAFAGPPYTNAIQLPKHKGVGAVVRMLEAHLFDNQRLYLVDTLCSGIYEHG